MSASGSIIASAAESTARAGLWLTSLGTKSIGRWLANDHNLEDYQYDQLPKAQHLRLLKITGTDGPRLRCTLETFPLASAPEYYAISYTWQDPFGDMLSYERAGITSAITGPFANQQYQGFAHKVLVCDDRRLLIRLNLFEALLRLLEFQSEGSMPHQYIWADAVCINQDDFLERKSQMLMMGDIYAQAVSVIAWLGEQLDDTFGAVSATKKLSTLSLPDTERMSTMSIFNPAAHVSLGMDAISFSEWAAFFSFSRRAFFERVWCVQEVVFASSLVYVAGSFRIDPETFRRVSNCLILSGWIVQLERQFLALSSAGTGPRPGSVAAVLLMKDQIREPGLLTPSNVFASVRGLKATKKQDYIYAMLNVIAKGQNVPPETLPIEIKDEPNLDELLEQATLWCIRTDRSLRVLSAVGVRLERSAHWRQPSWVVDWTQKLKVMPFAMINSAWSLSGLPQEEEPHILDEHLLAFRAANVGSIAQMSALGDDMLRTRDFSTILDIAPASSITNQGSLSQGLTETMWRTCCADTINGISPAPARAAKGWLHLCLDTANQRASRTKGLSFREAWESLSDQITKLRDLDRNSVFPALEETEVIALLLQSSLAGVEEACKDWQTDIEFCWTNIQYALTGRRFARMLDNSFALVPSVAKVGDCIWAVPGLSSLYAFRHTSPRNLYELLGDAYVHGKMTCDQSLAFEEVVLR